MSVDLYSTKNLEIRKNFIKQEVHYKVGKQVKYIFSCAQIDTPVEPPYTWEDVTNRYVDNSAEIDELECEINNILELLDEEEDDATTDEYREKIDALEDEIADLRSEENNIQDILEWWSVSPDLAQALKEWGEPIIEGYNIWGRTALGTQIYLDEVIGYICRDKGLLVNEAQGVEV